MDQAALWPSEAKSSKRVIAVVEDDATTLEVIQAMLEFDGYDVEVFSSVIEASQGVTAIQPCLVVLDLVLKGRDGGEVLDQLKADPVTATIPVIVCTAANLATATLEQLRRYGCPLLRKPFDMDILLETVRGLIV